MCTVVPTVDRYCHGVRYVLYLRQWVCNASCACKILVGWVNVYVRNFHTITNYYRFYRFSCYSQFHLTRQWSTTTRSSTKLTIGSSTYACLCLNSSWINASWLNFGLYVDHQSLILRHKQHAYFFKRMSCYPPPQIELEFAVYFSLCTFMLGFKEQHDASE